MNYLKQFEWVAAVAKYESISRAAGELGVAQPTLSKYLQKIENDLEIELFDRSRVPIGLTQAGECFVEAGRKMLDVDRQMKKRLNELKHSGSGEFRVGISPSRSPYLLPGILSEFRRLDGNTQVRVEERLTAQLSERLLNGEIDIVISVLDDATCGFERVELFEERLLLAVRGDLIAGAELSAKALLSSLPIAALGKGQYMREVLDGLLQGAEADVAIECHNIESAMAMVRAGLAATIVPSYISEYADGDRNSQIVFLELDDMPEKELYIRKVCLFYRREQFLTEAEKMFVDCARKSAEKMNETGKVL